MGQLFRNFRLSLRQFRAFPGFAATVVLTLALGIGATTSIFSILKAVVLNPLPFRDPQRLVHVWEGFRGSHYHRGDDAYFISVRPGTFYDWRAQSQSFSGISAYRWRELIFTRGGQSELLSAHEVVEQFFETLGTPAQLGRTLGASDYAPDAPRVAVLSDRLWASRFGRDPGIMGREISLDHQNYSVVGIMPQSFYPTGRDYPDLWIAHWADQKERDDRLSWGWTTVARLKPGITWQEAQIELDVVAARMAKQHRTYEKLGGVVVPLDAQLIGSSWKLLLLLWGGVGLLLLIACVNVANLLLARVVDREKEFSIRTALGAGRAQLAHQLFSESLVLAIAAGALGIAVASAGTHALLALLPTSATLPRLDSARVDLGVLAFVCAIILLTSLFFSVAPLLRVSGSRPYEALKTEGRGFSAGAAKRRLAQTFVVSEFIFSLVLLILGAVLVQSFLKLQRTDVGFNAKNLLTFHVQVPAASYGKVVNGEKSNPRQKLYTELERRLSAVPGVESVGLTAKLPLRHEFNPWSLRVEGREPPPPGSQGAAESSPGFGGHGDTSDQRVNPGYFEALGLKLVSGRFLDQRDNETAPMVAVVNETFARTFFANENPVGKRVTVDYTDWFPQFTIVGVVADFKLNALDRKPYPEMFWSLRQAPSENVWATVRARSEPEQLSAAIRREIQNLDSDLSVLSVHSMTEVVADSLWRQRLSAMLIGLLAALSLLLAATGIYSVTSYAVSQRTKELGIRIALGANRVDVLRLILGEISRLALVGSLLGCIAGYIAVHLATSQLYLAPSLASSQAQTQALNPALFLLSTLFLCGVAILASYAPARRALRVDPMIAMH